MKLAIILSTLMVGMAYGNNHLQLRATPRTTSTISDLETPLLEGSSSSKPGANHAHGKITAKSGPNHPASIVMSQGRARLEMPFRKDVPRGQVETFQNAHYRKSVVGGWPFRGGQLDTETTAKRVKIKMNPGHGLGTINRLKKDGSWSEEILSHEGPTTRWYKNEDDSPVTVKASLMGGDLSGSLKSTGKQYDQSHKKRKWS